MTIGRVGVSVALSEPNEWVENPDGTVSVGGLLENATAAQADHLRDQFLGLMAGLDEPVVPVTLGHDDSRDGWYRVLDGRVQHELGMTEVRSDRWWSATLQRILWWDQPRYELHRYGTVLANDHTLAEADVTPFVAFPDSATAVDMGSSRSWTRTTRTAESGTVALVYGHVDLFDTVVGVDLPIADVYDGAATLEVSVGGSYYPVVGRSVRKEHAGSWRIGNGLVRATWDSVNHGLAVSAYDGSWQALADSFQITDDGVTATALGSDPVAWAVLRNDPALTIVRLVFNYDSGTARIELDVAVRRGDRNVLCTLKSRESQAWGLKPDSSTASTYLTGGGVRSDSNDANGNRWVVSGPKAFTHDTGTGHIYLNAAATTFVFGVGVEVDGTSASGQSTADNVRKQFFAQPVETPFVTGV